MKACNVQNSLWLAAIIWGACAAPGIARPPNILLILADDLGYGDVGCYNSESKVATPHLDRMAAEGLRFTDAHSPSTVCTPTRYSLLTGRMAFRTGFRGVFVGAGGPCLIEPERLTLPAMLSSCGYKTALVGKWHVGMTWLDSDGRRIEDQGIDGVRRIDFSHPIPDGPVDRGFDYFFGTACCPTTDWLYAYIRDNQVPQPPTKRLDREPLPVHAYSRDNRRGMIAPDFDLERVDLKFLEESQRFLQEHVKTRRDQPFFLLHSMQAVHLPSFAAPEFQGRTKSGPHGDFLAEMDWIVGQLLQTLDELGIANDTMVMFTSDNGPEVTTSLAMRHHHQHDPARPWRGLKRDGWEGGHRIPWIIRWPAKVAAGVVSDQLVSLTDVMATCAAAVEADLPHDAAEDSYNLLPVLLGVQGNKPVRPYLLQQTIHLDLSIRRGDWKFLDHKGSGGNNYQRGGDRGLKLYALPDTAPDAPGQLYNLSTDPGETTNLSGQHPETVAELKRLLEASQLSGRSAPARHPAQSPQEETHELLHLKVDLAPPTSKTDPAALPGSAKLGWWPWVMHGNWDYYRTDLTWEDGRQRYPKNGPGLAGSGVHAALTCHYEGLLTYYVAGMRRYLAGGIQPEGEPVFDPICNSWVAASDFPSNPSSDLLLAFYDLPIGTYRLVSYHNSFNCRRIGDEPTGVECDQTKTPEPAIRSITVYPIAAIREQYFRATRDASVKDKPYGRSGEKLILPGKQGAGRVIQLRHATNVSIQQVKSDEQLTPSIIEFSTDGSPLAVVYAAGDGKRDDLRPHRRGGYAVLNAFELVQLSHSGRSSE